MEVLGPKEFVYRYNGEPDSQESLIDNEGTLPIPSADEVIMRKGREWKVAYADVELAPNNAHIPIVSVFLIEKDAAPARAA
jgi:hypothetical protein